MRFTRLAVTTCGLLFAIAGHAAAPTTAPAGTTGLCKDGTFSSAASKRGACRGHQGVQEWYAADGAAAPTAAMPASKAAPARVTTTTAAPAVVTPVAPPPAAPRPAPVAKTAPAVAPTPAPAPTTPAPAAVQAPGAAPGMVWANARTKVYHCAGDRWYGKTKEGSYMTAAQADAQGMRPAQGKACAAS